MSDTGFLHDPAIYLNLLKDNLTSRYPARTIVRELVQNANDADATVLHIGWTKGLPDAGHPLLRGPAIFAVNDGKFDPVKDARAIRSLGLNYKSEDRTKIGRFGLGLKSVFHLCEAFLYFASPWPGEPSDKRNRQLNPWSGPDGEPHYHDDWQDPTEPDILAVRKHLGNLLATSDWFCVWIPLRTEQHCVNVDPIIEWYPGDKDELPRDVFGTNRAHFAVELGQLLPMFRHLREINCWLPWQGNGETPAVAVKLWNESQQIQFDDLDEHSSESAWHGGVAIAYSPIDGSNQEQHSLLFSGHERKVSELLTLQDRRAWPKTATCTTTSVRRVKEKAEPHSAVCFTVIPATAGSPAVPAEGERGLKIGKNGRRLRKEVNTGISSSVIRAGWRFASQDGNSVLGEKSRRDPAASARTTHSAEAQASLGRCVVRTLAAGI